MGKNRQTGLQIKDGSVGRPDLNTTKPDQAVITKVIAGSGVTISSTGVVPGTGDVTINAAGGGGGVLNLDGGAPDSVYTPDQCFNGGDPSGN